MSTLIIVPTYNEKDTIASIIADLSSLNLDLRILVIDDNSPDGTGNLVDNISKTNKSVSVIHRSKKSGLGSAYIDGFRYAIENTNVDYVMEMDADYSHDPKLVPRFLEAIKSCDLVVGSRFYEGKISIVNWPLSRLILSYGASIYVRLFTRLNMYDPTSGFKCFRRSVLKSILNNKIMSNGYSFQIELNYMCKTMGFKIQEIPIVFYDRNAGVSKMRKFKTVLDAMLIVWVLKFKRFNKTKKD